MKKIVVDSSVIVKWLSQDKEEHLNEADTILKDAQDSNILLIAPELAKYEVGNVLLYGKNLASENAREVLAKFYDLPISFVAESETSSMESYKIAQETKITYYDASFLALAQQENAILVTDNIKHQGKATDVKVIPLSDYPISAE